MVKTMRKDAVSSLSSSDHSSDIAALNARCRELQTQLEQRDTLLREGYQAFLQASQQFRDYYGNIFESLSGGVIVTDLHGAITSINPSALGMLKESKEDLLGRVLTDVLPGFNYSDSNQSTQTIRLGAANHDASLLMVSSSMLQDKGRAVGMVVNLDDITILKQFEERAQRNDRFTAMGEMAATIAHEIRNPLGSIELFTSLLREGLKGDIEHQDLLNHISTGVNSMNHIVSNVLEFTKPRKACLTSINLALLLKDMQAFHGHTARLQKVQIEISCEDVYVEGDMELLKQVCRNLILNALEAMPAGGNLTLKCTHPSTTAAASKSTEQPIAAPKAVAELIFQDTGCGMSEQVKKRIFDPFYTTHSHGTGLGLAIVPTILAAHGASIDVYSTPEQGTAFVLGFAVQT